MKPFLQKITKKLSLSQFVIILGLLIIISINTFHLSKKIRVGMKYKALVPQMFVGSKFMGLNEFLTDIEYVGYYSPHDLGIAKHNKQFSQAQLVLAPVVLDEDYENQEYIIFDCSFDKTAEACIKKMKALNVRPLKLNMLRIILGKKAL